MINEHNDQYYDIVFARRADGPTPRFIRLIEAEAQRRGMSFVHCQSHEQAERMRVGVENQTLGIGCLIDYMGRSFRNDRAFLQIVRERGGLIVDDPDLVERYGNKATMHAALVRAGIALPRTLIWSADQPGRELTLAEQHYLGTRLVCKPSYGSGASGVVLDIEMSRAAIDDARAYDPDDDFLLQEFITPMDFHGRPAWFRVYNCFGSVFACWWHPQTHATYLLSANEINHYHLYGLERISRIIAAISGYTWFSCEIAVTMRGQRRVLLPIDYLNNKCYMLTHSEVGENGLPDILAEMVAVCMVERAQQHNSTPFWKASLL